MSNLPIRTITLGIAEAHPLPKEVITRSSGILRRTASRFEQAGYEVQTTRLSTRPVFDDLPHWSGTALCNYAVDLQRMLDDEGIQFCSLGPAQAARPDFPLARIDVIADLLAATSAINATVQLALLDDGLRVYAARHAARVIQRLARETAEGFGNFRFATLACVNAGCPFFPAAYHLGPSSLALGLQGAGIVARALQARDASVFELEEVSKKVRVALLAEVTPVVALAQRMAAEQELAFGGIDLSPAPLGEDSIVAVMEGCGYGPIGSPGTVAVAAAITTALKSTALPTCGYCGLMLPVLEDARLGRSWAEGKLSMHELLLYSAVCGTGLDTIPLAGATSEQEIAGILLDVAALALRLRKPLSARLFPVPGKGPGERTTFSSPYLSNTTLR